MTLTANPEAAFGGEQSIDALMSDAWRQTLIEWQKQAPSHRRVYEIEALDPESKKIAKLEYRAQHLKIVRPFLNDELEGKTWLIVDLTTGEIKKYDEGGQPLTQELLDSYNWPGNLLTWYDHSHIDREEHPQAQIAS